MKPLLLSFFAFLLTAFSGSDHQEIKITYLITNKVMAPIRYPGITERDQLADSLITEMLRNMRISHEFDLTSELGNTSLSAYRLVGQTDPRMMIGPYHFRNGQWMGQSLLKNPDMYEVDYKETDESKTILGYSCKKFVCRQRTADSLAIEIWATKRLPAYINPVVGLTNFPHGILEAVIGDSAEVIRATEVKISVKSGKEKKVVEARI